MAPASRLSPATGWRCRSSTTSTTARRRCSDAYRRARGDFAETLSPDLPNGLNAGRQLFWLSRTFPDAFARTEAILPYPQYWVWRLTGRKAAEVTSLGCHTDLWAPRRGDLFAACRQRRLGPPVPAAGQGVGHRRHHRRRRSPTRTGIAPTARVVAGIHDSNASLLPHVLTRRAPFAVLSTGTWTIVLAPGGSIDQLDPARDCLANVDAFGRPVPSARFMGGREFGILADGSDAEPSDAEVARVVADEIMALPTFAPGTGPFGKGQGHWTVDPAGLSPGERVAAASLYAAMVTETCLALAGADGPVIVEGPFARNRLFLAALAQRIPRPILAVPDATGTVDGAALLAFGPDAALHAEGRAAGDPACHRPWPPTPRPGSVSAAAVRQSAQLPSISSRRSSALSQASSASAISACALSSAAPAAANACGSRA